MNKTQKTFWEKCHLEGKVDHLSGVPGDLVISCLGIKDLINSDAHVLEIGVGLGTCFSYIKDRCAAVYAADISQRALDRVASISSGNWLEEHMQYMPVKTFDLAFCFNVVQHLELATFTRHLKLVFSALKPGGIFAFQFIYRLDGGPSEPELAGALQAGAMTHNPDQLKDLAKSIGYTIHKELDLGQTAWAEAGCYVLQVRK